MSCDFWVQGRDGTDGGAKHDGGDAAVRPLDSTPRATKSEVNFSPNWNLKREMRAKATTTTTRPPAAFGCSLRFCLQGSAPFCKTNAATSDQGGDSIEFFFALVLA